MQATNSSEAMSFWASKAQEYDRLIRNIDSVLPTVNNDGDLGITEHTKKSAIEAFEEARLAAETVLGGYTHAAFNEQTAAQQNGHVPHYARW